MGKTTHQLKQLEALFVPTKGGHIEFAGVVEANRDETDHQTGRRGSGSIKAVFRDKAPNGVHTKRDSLIGDGTSGNDYNISFASGLTKRHKSVDRELGVGGGGNMDGENIYSTIQRRRSSGGKTHSTAPADTNR